MFAAKRKKALFKELFYLLKKIPTLKVKEDFFTFCAKSVCYFCRKAIKKEDFYIGTTYWKNYYFPSHKKCYDKKFKKAVYQCQKIDADCNDCYYFVRWEHIGNRIWTGFCNKFKKEVKAYPVFCSCHKCFVHRLDKKK